MTRRMLTDAIWEELKIVMKAKGCHHWKNDRQVMEAILWKLRTGAPWRDIPTELCPWKTAYNRFNRWAKKGLWEAFFLSYEEKLIRNGCSLTEATSRLISMQVELGVLKPKPSDAHEEGIPQNCTWSPMRMETRLILKSLGVKCTTPKLLKNSSKK